MWSGARTALTCRSPTTPVATGTAPGARARRPSAGSKPRQAELLPVAYYHVVFTVPAEVADIGFHNKAVVYDILFKAASETLLTIGKDPKHLGARLGVTAVPAYLGFGAHPPPPTSTASCPAAACRSMARAGSHAARASSCPCGCSRACSGGCSWTGSPSPMLKDSSPSSATSRASPTARAFTTRLAPLRRREWVVYAKRPFAGPEAVLAYLARYTHRVAISSSRLVSLDHRSVAFRYKDYRGAGPERQKRMRLDAAEFIRRFPDPRPCPGLPPHPPLRPVRQHAPRRQSWPSSAPCSNHSPVPTTVQAANDNAAHRGRLPLSLLWRPYAADRGVRARRPAPPRARVHRPRDR